MIHSNSYKEVFSRSHGTAIYLNVCATFLAFYHNLLLIRISHFFKITLSYGTIILIVVSGNAAAGSLEDILKKALEDAITQKGRDGERPIDNTTLFFSEVREEEILSSRFDKPIDNPTRPQRETDPPISQMGLDTGVYTIRQLSNHRYLDAHNHAGKDFSVVTRGAENNDSQKWVLTRFGSNTYTIRQKLSGRYLDAHDTHDRDFSIVTRGPQNNDSQKWILKVADGNTFTIKQKNTGRFVDAHETKEKDFSVVTRGAQNNRTQKWTFLRVVKRGGGRPNQRAQAN